MHPLTEEVYSILTANKVRRAWPRDPSEVKEYISFYLEVQEPIVLVTNWLGVKITEKGIADKTDETTLSFLRDFIIAPLKEKQISVTIKILFTDINASFLEGYSRDRIELYWKTLHPMIEVQDSNFMLVRVNGELWNNIFVLDGKENYSLEEIAQKVEASHLMSEVTTRAKQVISGPYFPEFVRQAKRHSQLVGRGSLSAEDAARRYIFFRIFARRRYHELFPHEIYFSYAGPDINELIISQPSIYLFSFHKGCSICPWFIDEADESYRKFFHV